MFHAQQLEEHMYFQPQPQRGSKPLTSLVVLLVLLLAAAYLFRDAITAFMQERASRAHHEQIALEQSIRRNALGQELEITVEPIQQEMRRLNQIYHSLSYQIESIVGLPLEIADVQSTRKLDYAILTSDSFAEVWARLLNSRITPALFEQKESALTELYHRINNDSYSYLDKQHLAELYLWIQQAKQQLERQEASIVFLSNNLSNSDM